jgi:hypothetical protein
VIDLFSGWRRAPIETVVDMLRSIHEGNVREAEERAVHDKLASERHGPVHEPNVRDGAQPAAAATATSDDQRPPGSGTAAHAAQLVAALLAWPHASTNAPGAELSYDALSRRVLDFQAQARRQKLALERLLGQAFAADNSAGTLVPTFQQTLYLQCPRDGRSAGRFRCVNRTARAASFEVKCEPMIGKASGRLPGAQAVVEPSTGTVGPGESMTLQAIVDFSRCGPIDDDEVGAAAEVRLDGDCVLKLWIAVELT